MTIPTNDILPLIPQRKPFVMVDALVYVDTLHTRTTFAIRPDNIFVKNGELREPALVENIAQTAATRSGWLAQAENKPSPVGYIGAIQNLEIYALPKVNSVIETEVRLDKQIFDVSVILGKIWCEGVLLAQCEMKIFIKA